MRFLRPLTLLILLASSVRADVGEVVDLALVLAVDVSGSIDPREFALQREGYTAAFRDPRVIETIRSGTVGAIAVTYIQWSGWVEQRQMIGWTRLKDTQTATAFADAIAATGRFQEGGSTSISGAILYALRLWETSPYPGRKLVIDISGDGKNNSGKPPDLARDEAVAAGATINGLPILSSDEPMMDAYYRDMVIGGHHSFVAPADGYARFGAAILDKLLREIAQAPSGRAT